MPGKSQSHTDAVLNALLGSALNGVTPYVGLFSTAPANDAEAGIELSGNGYQRQAITFGAPTTDAGNVRKISNTNTITFGPLWKHLHKGPYVQSRIMCMSATAIARRSTSARRFVPSCRKRGCT